MTLYTNEIDGERFRLWVCFGDRQAEMIAESLTVWTDDAQFLHENPPFGCPSVRYRLEVFLAGGWADAGTAAVDLSAFILSAPSIDLAA